MKRIIMIILSLVMMFTMAACGNEKVQEPAIDHDGVEAYQDAENTEAGDKGADSNTDDGAQSADPAEETKDDSQAGNDKILIVYFSRAENIEYDNGVDAVTSASIYADKDGNAVGSLRVIAEYLQEETKADLFSIHIVDKYPKSYHDTTSQASDEKDKDARPELSNKVDNMEQYETILLGYPIWCGTIPMPVATFLESYDFSGKTIILFASYESSEFGSSPSDIKKLCPDAKVKDGFVIRGSDAKSDEAKKTVADFVKGLEL